MMHLRVLAAALLLFLGAVSSPQAADWTYESMQGVTSTCVEADHVNGRVLVGTIEGFHYLDLGTGTWTSRDWPGWIGRQVHSIAWHETLGQRVITGRENAFFKGYIELSNDLGVSEHIVYNSQGGSVTGLARDALDVDRYYACTWSDVAPGEIVRSLDGGETWTLLSATIHYAMTSITVDHAGVIYVGGSSRVTRSTTGGDTWEPAWNGLPSGYGVYCVCADPGDGGHLFASNDLGIYRSLDGGDSWTQVSNVSCRNIDWARPGWIVPGGSSARPVAGVTWDDRVLVSHNMGIDWQDETGNLLGTPVDLAFSIEDGYVYVATTGAGTFRARIVDPQAVAAPMAQSGPALLQAPTPFRPGEAIWFRLAFGEHATVEILDAQGRQVEQLASGWFTPGCHAVRWDGAGLPAGMYWAHLRTNHGRESARIVLVR